MALWRWKIFGVHIWINLALTHIKIEDTCAIFKFGCQINLLLDCEEFPVLAIKNKSQRHQSFLRFRHLCDKHSSIALYGSNKVASGILRSSKLWTLLLEGEMRKPPVTLFYCICVIDTTNYKIRLDLESNPRIKQVARPLRWKKAWCFQQTYDLKFLCKTYMPHSIPVIKSDYQI